MSRTTCVECAGRGSILVEAMGAHGGPGSAHWRSCEDCHGVGDLDDDLDDDLEVLLTASLALAKGARGKTRAA